MAEAVLESEVAAPALAEPVKIKPLPEEVRRFLDQFDFSVCMTCNTCTSGCPITGNPGAKGIDIRKALRMLSLGLVDELVESKFPWICTGCGRCAEACPMDIDIPYLMLYLKSLRARDKVPGILHKGVAHVLESGNNMAVPRDDYLFLMSDLGQELADEGCPGFYVPIDEPQAKIGFFPNSKEVFADNEDMKWWWKIFYAAREDWTVPLENWEAVDWGLFTGNYEATDTLAKRKMDWVRRLQIERMIMPDCGGGSYGCRVGMKHCVLEDPDSAVNFVYLYEYLKALFEEGRIKVDKSVNAGKTFTWHDSCKHGRELMRHFGQAFFEEPRWIIQQCVDSFVETVPNRMRGYCCGAGGGNWPGPYEEDAVWHGRAKFNSIKASGADVVVVGCSNCHDQLMKRLPKFIEDDFKYEVMYIWELVAESLIIEPWSDEEVEKAQAEAKAQWERLEFDPEAFL